eukprot:8624500-Pyramimonas_sp.AAC.1
MAANCLDCDWPPSWNASLRRASVTKERPPIARLQRCDERVEEPRCEPGQLLRCAAMGNA